MSGHPYDLLAELLEYPRGGVVAVAERCRTLLARRSPEASAEVETFEAFVAGIDERELEELYARTFDLNPPAALDLGYQLFGESYKRGIFLVKMQRAVLDHGIDPGSELCDHLPLVLRLVARLRDDEDPRSLVDEVVLPTTLKILKTFAEENPYCALLRAVLAALQGDFEITNIRELPREIAFPDPDDGFRDGKRRLDVLPQSQPPRTAFGGSAVRS